MKKYLSLLLTLSLIFSLAGPAQTVSAATVKLNKSKISISVGESVSLKLLGTSNAPKWTSSNKKIATVSSKGLVKAVKEGSANVTATSNGKKYVCKVNVNGKNVVVTVTSLMSFDELTEFIKSNKIKSIENEEDFTTTYTLSLEQQKNILEILKDYFDKNYLAAAPSYYKSISVNDDFTSFKVKVNGTAYKSNTEPDPTALGILLFSSGYQQFMGVKDNEFKISYSVIDINTEEVIEKFDQSDLSN
jgi:hypothetical protein